MPPAVNIFEEDSDEDPIIPHQSTSRNLRPHSHSTTSPSQDLDQDSDDEPFINKLMPDKDVWQTLWQKTIADIEAVLRSEDNAKDAFEPDWYSKTHGNSTSSIAYILSWRPRKVVLEKRSVYDTKYKSVKYLQDRWPKLAEHTIHGLWFRQEEMYDNSNKRRTIKGVILTKTEFPFHLDLLKLYGLTFKDKSDKRMKIY